MLSLPVSWCRSLAFLEKIHSSQPESERKIRSKIFVAINSSQFSYSIKPSSNRPRFSLCCRSLSSSSRSSSSNIFFYFNIYFSQNNKSENFPACKFFCNVVPIFAFQPFLLQVIYNTNKDITIIKTENLSRFGGRKMKNFNRERVVWDMFSDYPDMVTSEQIAKNAGRDRKNNGL